MLDFVIGDVKDLSGVGDSFVNLIYSIAVSNAAGKPVSKRASNYVLSEAVHKSGLREPAGPRADRHKLADYAECQVFNAWLRGNTTLENCVEILTRELKSSPGSLKEASIQAFTVLLKDVQEKVNVNAVPENRRPAITVDAVIERDGKILLIKRKNEPFKGRWGLPGGFVEYGESAEDAITREVKEEANLDMSIKALVGIYSKPGRDPRGHVISICYKAFATGKEKGGTDASDAAFFTPAKIKGPELAFDHKDIIADYMESKCSVKNAKA
ncbi:MAG: ribonuclease III family protein [Candidatus Hydrothermarchaeaceae archaeon]